MASGASALFVLPPVVVEDKLGLEQFNKGMELAETWGLDYATWDHVQLNRHRMSTTL